jgi:hypothetical protein
MASIKVSELPAVTSITSNDVLIINDENAVTSSINITFFTSSFTGQDLSFTGTASFAAPVTFGPASLPTFNSDTVFNERATFNGPITLGALADISLDQLSDVTIPAIVPDGYVLAWNQPANTWQPEVNGNLAALIEDTTPQLGGNLDVNGYTITSDPTVDGPNGQDIIIDPVGAGKVTIKGNSTGGSGKIVLNCEVNTHGVIFQGPPHSAAASYTFTLPNTMGTTGQVLTTNGTSITSWSTLAPATIGAATAAQGVTADSAMQVNGNNVIPEHADDAAAATGGVVVGGLYRIGNAVQVRLA